MKVAIIGTGRVGATTAFCLAGNEKIDKIVLINRTKEIAEGLKMDLMGTFPESAERIVSGDFSDANDVDVILITCGVSGAPQSMGLFDVNKEIIESVMQKIKPKKEASLILTATPIDEIALVGLKLSGLVENKVIGFGGQLDVNRLKYLIYNDTGDFSKELSIRFIGTHGAEGIPVFEENVSDRNDIANKSKNFYKTFLSKSKFSTFAVGSELAKLVDALIKDEEIVMDISYYDSDKGFFITWPCVVNKDGVKGPVDLKLSDEEKEELDELIKKKLEKD